MKNYIACFSVILLCVATACTPREKDPGLRNMSIRLSEQADTVTVFRSDNSLRRHTAQPRQSPEQLGLVFRLSLFDSIICSFSHTHLSGTGIGDLQDIRFLPVITRPDSNQSPIDYIQQNYAVFPMKTNRQSPDITAWFLTMALKRNFP